MPTLKIPPDSYISLEYKVPKSRLVEFEIDADRPVKTYVLGPKTLKRFEQGSKNFRYYGGFPEPRRHQSQEVRLPFSGLWYLVISNRSLKEPARVEYEVYY